LRNKDRHPKFMTVEDMSENNREKIKRLVTFIKRNPSDSFSKFALALELLKQEEIQKARILFESIRESDPGYVGVYYHLGKLYERIGWNNKAKNTFEEGIKVAGQKQEERTQSELQEALDQLTSEME